MPYPIGQFGQNSYGNYLGVTPTSFQANSGQGSPDLLGVRKKMQTSTSANVGQAKPVSMADLHAKMDEIQKQIQVLFGKKASNTVEASTTSTGANADKLKDAKEIFKSEKSIKKEMLGLAGKDDKLKKEIKELLKEEPGSKEAQEKFAKLRAKLSKTSPKKAKKLELLNSALAMKSTTGNLSKIKASGAEGDALKQRDEANRQVENEIIQQYAAI